MFQLTVEEIDYSWLEIVRSDVPLRLSEAIFLPELDGRFSEKQLRTAIAAGNLPAERLGRSVYVTKAGIAEWRANCRVRPNPPDFGSSRPAPENVVSQRDQQSGSFCIEEKSAAQVAASSTLSALKKRLVTT